MTTPSDPPDEDRTVRHRVSEADAGERADVVLGRRVPGLSRRVARTLARAGKLRIDGTRSPPATRVETGQELALALELERGDERALAPLDELEILACTDDFVYVHKPAGVHTVALTPAQPGVLATAVAARFPECASASEDPREGGAVHRLDRPTSGVVAFARSPAAWRRARDGFRDERVTKHYLAVSTCVGPPLADRWPPPLPEGGLRGWLEPHPPLGGREDIRDDALAAVLDPLLGETDRLELEAVRIRAAIGRDGPRRSAVRLDGRRAATVVQPLARHDSDCLVRLVLETGRRHQARVHLAWVGLPIRGDTTYGPKAGPDAGVPRPAQSIRLHAFALDLSAVFETERPILTGPTPGFWPPR